MDKLLAKIYRSPRHEGMYLYVAASAELSHVPASLLEHFGSPEQAMVLLLDGERKLAHAEADEVREAIAQRGFYLQMPAGEEDPQMVAVAARNDKLSRAN